MTSETFFNKGYQAYHKGQVPNDLPTLLDPATLKQKLEFQNGWLYARANDKRKENEHDRQAS